MRLPLTYQGEQVGELLFGPHAPNETFGPANRRLLEGLARQAGVAAYAVRLTSDLQHPRERLVAAREEERRRLRRDLHDGLGASPPGGAPPQAFPTLTDREREILNLIAQGHPNPSIARQPSLLSTKSVGNYVSNVFTKLQIADRTQAMIHAREAGLGLDSRGCCARRRWRVAPTS